LNIIFFILLSQFPNGFQKYGSPIQSRSIGRAGHIDFRREFGGDRDFIPILGDLDDSLLLIVLKSDFYLIVFHNRLYSFIVSKIRSATCGTMALP
jgi:hypothetical protein